MATERPFFLLLRVLRAFVVNGHPMLVQYASLALHHEDTKSTKNSRRKNSLVVNQSGSASWARGANVSRWWRVGPWIDRPS
jgi:hypothetical protein